MIDAQQRRDVYIVTISNEQPIARDEVDEASKTRLDLGKVLKNIGVVEFKVVEHRHFREVMDKFAALVKKSCVVFVALDDEPCAVRKARTL